MEVFSDEDPDELERSLENHPGVKPPKRTRGLLVNILHIKIFKKLL